jgi:hypothetical protein
VRVLIEYDELCEEHTLDSATRKLFVRIVALFEDISGPDPSSATSEFPEENFKERKAETGKCVNGGAEP